jgi:hypothetical protein
LLWFSLFEKSKLFGFEGDLAADMKKMNVDSIVMEFTFPNNFPFGPPFCRVLRPRFRFMTGWELFSLCFAFDLFEQAMSQLEAPFALSC